MRIVLAALMALAATGAKAGEPTKGKTRNPDWLNRPTAEQIQAAWPLKAWEQGQSGRVVVRCQVTPLGALEGCQVISEDPAGFGFGGAASC